MKEKITATIETIDPKKAAEYLALNTKNRALVGRHLQSLTRDMKNGRWISNGDPIRFNSDKLIDGQHRLQAIIDSGVTLEFVVIRQLPEKAFETIDIGRKRSMPDLLSIEGKGHPQILSSAIAYVARYMIYGNIRSHERITHAERFEVLATNPQVERLAEIYAARGYPLKTAPSVLAAVHYLCWLKNRKQADDYMNAVVMGENLVEGDPAFAVRRWIIRAHTAAPSPRTAEYTALVLIRGWNAFRAGERLTTIKGIDQIEKVE